MRGMLAAARKAIAKNLAVFIPFTSID